MDSCNPQAATEPCSPQNLLFVCPLTSSPHRHLENAAFHFHLTVEELDGKKLQQ